MIDTCDPSIAAWSDDGSAFVVKDTDKFASEVIGQFFKHNNFSSFVRQLNFYGFRKIKSDPLRISDAAEDIESKYWKFRHEKFQRRRPDLLVEIRKTNHTEAAEKHEVDALRREVQELKSKLSNMTSDMERLASLVKNITQGEENSQDSFGPPQQGATKKRRVMPPLPNSVQSTCGIGDPISKPLPVASLHGGDIPHTFDPFGEMALRPMPSPVPIAGGRQKSTNSLSSLDEEILASLFASDSSDEMNDISGGLPDLALSGDILRKQSSDVDMNLVNTLKDALARLPRNLQELFVERMVASIANPGAFQKQVDAVGALAVAAVEEAKRRYGDEIESSPESVERATSVLGSFLYRYGRDAAGETRNNASESSRPLIEL
jgi:hypothetical protein